MTAPRVSVVLCVFNDRGDLRRTVASVLAQSAGDLELIVVDDGSTDSTPRTLSQLAADDDRVRVVTNSTNRGLTPAINIGLGQASAPWVARIDEGDTWSPEKLARQLARVEADPGLVLIGARCVYRCPISGRELLRPPLPLDDASVRRAFVSGLNPVISSAALFKRLPGLHYNEGAALQRGVSDPISDYEYWLRLSFLGRVANLPEALVDFRYGPQDDGITSSRAATQFGLKLQLHAQLIEVLRSGDRVRAGRLVREGFQLRPVPAAGRRRAASIGIRYAASYKPQPVRGLLRGVGYLLQPRDLAFHLWSKAWLPRALEGADWADWVAI